MLQHGDLSSTQESSKLSQEIRSEVETLYLTLQSQKLTLKRPKTNVLLKYQTATYSFFKQSEELTEKNSGELFPEACTTKQDQLVLDLFQ